MRFHHAVSVLAAAISLTIQANAGSFNFNLGQPVAYQGNAVVSQNLASQGEQRDSRTEFFPGNVLSECQSAGISADSGCFLEELAANSGFPNVAEISAPGDLAASNFGLEASLDFDPLSGNVALASATKQGALGDQITSLAQFNFTTSFLVSSQNRLFTIAPIEMTKTGFLGDASLTVNLFNVDIANFFLFSKHLQTPGPLSFSTKAQTIDLYDFLEPGDLVRLTVESRAFSITTSQGVRNADVVKALGPAAGTINFGLSIDPSPVPEPSTFVFLGLGLSALGLVRRYRER